MCRDALFTFQWSFVLCCYSCSAFQILVPRPGIIKPTALQWKRKVLTSGPPGKPLSGHRLCLASLHLSVCLSFVGKHGAPLSLCSIPPSDSVASELCLKDLNDSANACHSLFFSKHELFSPNY